MAEEDPDVRDRMFDLLLDNLQDLDQLQLLLLLAARRQPLSAAELAREAGIPPEVAAASATALSRLRLVSEKTAGSFLYEPADPGMDAVVRKLEEDYRANPASIIRILTAKSIERLRAAALLAFADAFVLRRKDDE